MKAYYPWYCKSPEMRTPLLVMCKLLFLLLIFHGFHNLIRDPFIPFIPALDSFNKYPGVFQWSLRSLFLIGGISLFLNIRVRAAAILLGTAIIIALLASKPIFRNHLFICGCMFLLSGLSDKDQAPRLLIFQLCILYFGAVLNKVLQYDWWDGQFMHNWLYYARENVYYKQVYGLFPDMTLAKLLSWGSMLVELSIFLLLLVRKRHGTTVWIILLFHGIMYTITGTRFGHFFEDLLIYLLVFSSWPEQQIEISINLKNSKASSHFLSFINWNKQFLIRENAGDKEHWLHVRYSDKNYFNHIALAPLILFTPATYMLLLLFDFGALSILDGFFEYPYNRIGWYIITLSWLWGGILFFSYVSFRSNFDKRSDQLQRRSSSL